MNEGVSGESIREGGERGSRWRVGEGRIGK